MQPAVAPEELHDDLHAAAWQLRMRDPEAFAEAVACLPPGPVTSFLQGRVALSQGQLDVCLTRCQEADAGLVAPSVWRARLLETQGNTLNALGLDDEAQAMLSQAWSIYRALGDRLGEASARQNIASLRFQSPEVALELYLEARDIARELGEETLEGIVEINIATLEEDLDVDPEERMERLLRAHALLVTSWPDLALDAIATYVDVALDAGHAREAAELATLIPDPRTVPDLTFRCVAATALARLALEQDRPLDAHALLRDVLALPLRLEDRARLLVLHARALEVAGRTAEALTEAYSAIELSTELNLAEQRTRGRGLDAWYRTALLRQEREAEQARADSLEVTLSELRAATHRIHELSIRDTLTGLHNRQYLMDHAPQAVAEACDERPAQVALIDIDHFKSVNDTFGHAAGDVVLTGFATVLRAFLPGSDLVARYGGEEFVVVRPPASPGGHAASLCSDLTRLRPVLQTLSAETEDGVRLPPVTVSAGVVTLAHRGLEGAFAAADRLMYEAKANGRDQVRCDGPSPSHADRDQPARGDRRGDDQGSDAADPP